MVEVGVDGAPRQWRVQHFGERQLGPCLQRPAVASHRLYMEKCHLAALVLQAILYFWHTGWWGYPVCTLSSVRRRMTRWERLCILLILHNPYCQYSFSDSNKSVFFLLCFLWSSDLVIQSGLWILVPPPAIREVDAKSRLQPEFILRYVICWKYCTYLLVGGIDF